MKAKTILFLLLALAFMGCSRKQPVRILPNACDGATNSDKQAFTITASDDVTEQCLIIEAAQELITWRWSEDGNVFAYALLDPTTTLPAMDGRRGYYRPPATKWHIADSVGNNVKRFSIADNKKLEFSVDGKYAAIQEYCYYTTCQHSIYEVSTSEKICEYKTEAVWFGESDCPNLVLKDGRIWDIRKEINDAGCRYYEQNRWGDIPGCK